MMRPLLRLAASLALYLLASQAWGSDLRRLVLVTTGDKPAWLVNNAEVRRLFLGRPVVKNDIHLTPLINQSDSLLYEVFLQKVVFMSAPAYERHLLSNVIRLGDLRPQVVLDQPALMSALRRGPETVTYMWDDTARRTPGITVIEELWHGPVE